jgi:hypothetical protein
LARRRARVAARRADDRVGFDCPIRSATQWRPSTSDHPKWQHTQDYWREKDELPAIDLDSPEFVHEVAPAAMPAKAAALEPAE